MFKKFANARSTIKTLVTIAVLCFASVLSLAFGASAFGFRMEGDPTPFGDGGISPLPEGSKGCYLKNESFEGTTSPIRNSDQVLEKIGSQNRQKLERNRAQLDSLIAKALAPENDINPALLIAIWGGESTFDNDGKALGCAVYTGVDPEFRAKATKNFDAQVDCAISQGIKKAMERRAPYNAPSGQNTFTRLFFNYTGAMKNTYNKYGYVADSNNSRIKILNALVPDQVECDTNNNDKNADVPDKK